MKSIMQKIDYASFIETPSPPYKKTNKSTKTDVSMCTIKEHCSGNHSINFGTTCLGDYIN